VARAVRRPPGCVSWVHGLAFRRLECPTSQLPARGGRPGGRTDGSGTDGYGRLPGPLLESVSQGVPATLAEVITLGRTLNKRAADVLAYFDRPGTSNGPTEAINGRLEHLRGSALGFRNLTNYIARALLETGGFKPRLHPRLR
jgi:hypothetical protein